MRLALAVPYWQDGHDLLQATVDSLDGLHDLLIVADGPVEGVDQQGLPDLDELGWLPAGTVLEQRRWWSQGQKRDWILQQARNGRCDWLLQLDADERLHQPGTLAAWLSCWQAGAFPLPFEHDRQRWPGMLIGASWKCVHVPTWSQVVLQGAYLRHSLDGRVYCLVPPEGRLDGFVDGLPYVSHHPEERRPERRQIRLSALEDMLEPPPPAGAEPYPTPGFHARPALGQERFFCDQCGLRFRTPGVCDHYHRAVVVQPLQEMIAA